jgi:hypothetical protein
MLGSDHRTVARMLLRDMGYKHEDIIRSSYRDIDINYVCNKHE